MQHGELGSSVCCNVDLERFFEPSMFNFLTMDNESPIYWGMLAKCDSFLKR